MSLGPLVRTLLLSDAAIAALVGTRVYPTILPQASTFPAITYQRISRIPVADHLSDVGALARPRVQVDSWAGTRDGAEALGEAVRRKLNGYRGPVAGSEDVQMIQLDAVRDLYDDDVKLHRHSADYFVFHEED